MSNRQANRRRRKPIKRTQFTMMVCGASGTGKTTFINCLCGGESIPPRNDDDLNLASISSGDQLRIEQHRVELEDDESNSRINLTIIDTPGFGTSLDNTKSLESIVQFLVHQFENVLHEESRINRKPKFCDTRVHCCIYFIEPTSHGLREIDVKFMSALSAKVNLIPVIGQADQLTPSELILNKRLIMEDIIYYNILIYSFPTGDDEEYDNLEVLENDSYSHSNEDYSSDLFSILPFALVCSVDSQNGRNVRKYPWGIVEVEDPTHSDFMALKQALLLTHLNDLRETTHEILYEHYRTEKLSRKALQTEAVKAAPPKAAAAAAMALQQSPRRLVNYRIKGPSSYTNSSNFSAELHNVPLKQPNRPFQTNSYMPNSLPQEFSPVVTGNNGDHIYIDDVKFREIEARVQREIEKKKKELSAREQELQEIEAKITAVSQQSNQKYPQHRRTSVFPIPAPEMKSVNPRLQSRNLVANQLRGHDRRETGHHPIRPAIA